MSSGVAARWHTGEKEDHVEDGRTIAPRNEPLALLDPAPPLTQGRDPDRLGVAVVSLVSFVVVGVALSGYCLYYTDYFPLVGGLLGLGGLFSCVAFLSNLVPEALKKQLQDEFDRRVLRRHRSWMVLTVVALCFVGWAAGRGTIIVDAVQGDLDRAVTIGPDGMGAAVVDGEPLAAQGGNKFLVPTEWMAGRVYRVKVSGLPETTVEARAFRRTRVAVPASFLGRPILLVRPSATHTATAAGGAAGTLSLEVHIGGRLVGAITPYHGESVWVGCDEDVIVPASVQNRWRLELVKDGIPEIAVNRWLTPRAVGERERLRAGQQGRIEILHPDRSRYVHKDFSVLPARALRDFPQEVRIE